MTDTTGTAEPEFGADDPTFEDLSTTATLPLDNVSGAVAK